MFKVRKDWWNVNYIQSYAIYTKKFAKPVSHTSMSERVVPWRSVSCDNLQDSPVELIRVCKRSAVEKSLETLHSPREGVGGRWWCGSSRRQSARGDEINIFPFKKVFLRPKIIYYSAK